MNNSKRGGFTRRFSRRHVLRGAGVALTLPWLESLEPRAARAQALQPPVRFMPIFLPDGAPELWKPARAGAAAAWALSSVLEPLTALKSQVTVISGLENGSVFNADGSPFVEPEDGRQSGAWLTCVDSVAVRQRLGVMDANGISVDQVLAAYAPIGQSTPLASLQVGLSSAQAYCDAEPCSLSRSVSWQTPTKPLYKLVDPKQVFDLLVRALPGGAAPTASTPQRQLMEKSVLDAVLESALVVRPKLSAQDTKRLDEYLDSVRSVEQRIGSATAPAASNCQVPPAPVFVDLSGGTQFRQNTAGYDKGVHADLMNDLLVMAFQCNLTRVVSYMLEDQRSEFSYDNVPLRTFTASTSTPSSGVCGNYTGAQHGSQDEFATITWWNVGKVADLCRKLAATDDGNGKSVLDNSVVFLGSCTHGSNHICADLPALLVGGGGGALKTDQHLTLTNRPLRDLYFTLMKQVFGAPITDFGVNLTGAALAPIDEILA